MNPDQTAPKFAVFRICRFYLLPNNSFFLINYPDFQPRFGVIKHFHAQLGMYLILLINVKMPAVVGILTFISWINTTSESFKARK